MAELWTVQVCDKLPGGVQHVRLQRNPLQPREPQARRDLRHQKGHQVAIFTLFFFVRNKQITCIYCTYVFRILSVADPDPDPGEPKVHQKENKVLLSS